MRTLAVTTAAFVAIAVLLGVAVSRPATSAPKAPAAATSAATSVPAAATAKPTAAATSPAASPARTGAPAASAVDVALRADDLAGPMRRTGPSSVEIELATKEVVGTLGDGSTYTYWTFNGTVPGPFLRVRVGDTVTVNMTNDAKAAWPHSIDLHAVTGPGGGAAASAVAAGEHKSFTFKALNQGLYVYHCASAPVPMHIANGMYGMILVEPAGGLPKVDREFYVMQAELYTNGTFGAKGSFTYSQEEAVLERPDYVVFNARPGALSDTRALKANVGEKVRIYFGVGGFQTSSFHVIGEIFDAVHPEGSSEALHDVQTTLVPAGGAAMVEFTVNVPGTYLLVDHTLTRVFNKGLLGQLVVQGPEDRTIFDGTGGSGH